MVDVQTVSIAIASASVVAGVVYYALQLRHQNKIRKINLFTSLYSAGTTDEFMDAFWKISKLQIKSYQDHVEQYGSIPNENPMNRALLKISYYYDQAGTLLYRKLIDIVTVYDVWGSSNPKMLYEKVKPIVIGVRKEFNEPNAFIGFEYLYDELKRKEPQLRKTWGKYLSQNS